MGGRTNGSGGMRACCELDRNEITGITAATCWATRSFVQWWDLVGKAAVYYSVRIRPVTRHSPTPPFLHLPSQPLIDPSSLVRALCSPPAHHQRARASPIAICSSCPAPSAATLSLPALLHRLRVPVPPRCYP